MKGSYGRPPGGCRASSRAGRQLLKTWRVVALSLGLAGALVGATQARTPGERLAEALRHRLEPPTDAAALGASVDGEALRDFYVERGYQPLWVSGEGARPGAHELVAALAAAARDGLRPEDYGAARLGALLSEAGPEGLVKLELLATRELLHYASDLRDGRLAPRTIDPELFVERSSFDPATVLRRVAGADDIGRLLRELAPSNPIYRRLRRVLADFRELEGQGGWPSLPAGASLREGDRGPRVAVLRERLEATRDITVPSDEPELFDAQLAQAVRRFQRRHGLEADAVVGANTRAALNVAVAERIRQIRLNMERWRWMPDDLGEQYILVNLAGFELDVVEAGSVVLHMRVIVGTPYRRTPVFSGRMTYLDFNPTWTVPPRIARLDVLPKLRENPAYLAAENMRVYSGWSPAARPLDPQEIDWSAVDPRRMPYRFVQLPGRNNALGRVKFMFPNRFHVYLHDTPARALFSRTVRSFSSGCIRVERPLELAEYLLADDPRWTRVRIEEAIASGKTVTVPLPRPVTVHLTYSTVWIGEGGTVHFRNDIYGRDALLSRALFPQPPRSGAP